MVSIVSTKAPYLEAHTLSALRRVTYAAPSSEVQSLLQRRLASFGSEPGRFSFSETEAAFVRDILTKCVRDPNRYNRNDRTVTREIELIDRLAENLRTK